MKTKGKENVDKTSSIAERETTAGQHMDWNKFRIVWRDNNVYRLFIKESLIIRAHKPRFNRTTHSVSLHRLSRATRETKEIRRRRSMTTIPIITTATTEETHMPRFVSRLREH
jgi:hypothetical protein